MDNNSEYLVHYGVLGMKWGVRKRKPSSGRRRKKNVETSEKKKRKGLSKNQKTALKVGAGIVAAALIAYGGYKLGKSGKLDDILRKGKTISEGLVGSNEIKKLSGKESVSQVVKSVNPLKGTIEGSKNCTLCSVASALRMKGLDVQALGTTSGKSFSNVIESAFKNSSSAVKEVGASRIKSSADMARILEKRFEEGSFGAINLPTNQGIGHAINWTIENGKTIFFDSQNEVADASSYFTKYLDASKLIEFARLDNLEVNTDTIKDFVKSRR